MIRIYQSDIMVYNDHIQVTGFPRSGTTLLMALLQATVESHKVYSTEISFESVLNKTNPEWTRSIAKRPNDLLKYRQWKKARENNPNISLILMVRDIRDIMTSVHYNVPGDYFLHWDYTYRVSGYKKFSKTPNGLKVMMEGYDKYRKDKLTMPIRYEGLIKHPDVIQSAIAHYLGIKFNGKKFSDHPDKNINGFNDHKRVYVPIDDSSIGKWRKDEHKEYIRKEFLSHPELFEILIRDGYEKDKDWIENL